MFMRKGISGLLNIAYLAEKVQIKTFCESNLIYFPKLNYINYFKN